MIAVFKYKIIGCHSEVMLPVGAEVLNAEFQGDQCFIWAKVDTEINNMLRGRG